MPPLAELTAMIRITKSDVLLFASAIQNIHGTISFFPCIRRSKPFFSKRLDKFPLHLFNNDMQIIAPNLSIFFQLFQCSRPPDANQMLRNPFLIHETCDRILIFQNELLKSRRR